VNFTVPGLGSANPNQSAADPRILQLWDVKGYQAAITQVPFGMVLNWVAEFAPDMARAFRKHK